MKEGLKVGEAVNYTDGDKKTRTGTLVGEEGGTYTIITSEDELVEVPESQIMGPPEQGGGATPAAKAAVKKAGGSKPDPKASTKAAAAPEKAPAKAPAKAKAPKKKDDGIRATHGKGKKDIKVVAQIKDGFLHIKIPVYDQPELSTSKKNIVIASSRGDKETGQQVMKQKLIVGVNAYIKNV